jgi:hypothetical protein
MPSAEGIAEVRLDAAIRSGDEDRIVRMLDAIGRAGASPAELDLIKELAKKTGSPVVRNAAAIALADLGAVGADELLIGLIKQRETRGANGTLLYALREMNAYVPLPVLIEILTEDHTYEALEGALDLVADNAGRYNEEQKAAAVSRLKPFLTSTDAHTSHSAKLAIKYLHWKAARRPRRR